MNNIMTLKQQTTKFSSNFQRSSLLFIQELFVVLVYIRTSEGSQPGILRPHPGPHTAHYVQLSHFIYFSPSSASTEGEYRILEPKFPDSGHCQSVLRRQCVLLLPPSTAQCQGRRHLRFYVICEPRGAHLLMLQGREINLLF